MTSRETAGCFVRSCERQGGPRFIPAGTRASQWVLDPTLEQRAKPPPPLILDGGDHRHHRP
eukprot:3661717-Alexandrium_andersonii.AAC.1